MYEGSGGLSELNQVLFLKLGMAFAGGEYRLHFVL